jgi:hypothetical protein
MKTFNIEVTEEMIPEDMIEEIQRKTVIESEAYFSSDGESIVIQHDSFCAGEGFDFEKLQPAFKIVDMIEDFDSDPDSAKRLIPTLESAIARLKEIVAEWGNDED